MHQRTLATLTTTMALAVIATAVSTGCSGKPPVVRPAVRSSLEIQPTDAASITGHDPRALPMYDGKTGQPMTWDDLQRRMLASDVIILGEQHDDALAHAVQLAVVQDAAARWPRAGALSMEMLERDEQFIVDDYLEGLIDAETFAKLTDSVTWAGDGSWAEWYQPIIDAAAVGGWSVVAANAPRRYVRIARTEGFGRLKQLPLEREAFIAVPRTWPMDYRQRFIDVMNGMGEEEEERDAPVKIDVNGAPAATQPAGTQPAEGAKPPATADMRQPTTGPSTETQPSTQPSTQPASRPASPHGPMKPEDIDPGFRSQLLWDSTMADSIARALRTAGTRKVIHLVGQFHSDFRGGTVQELLARRPIARVLTVSMQRGDGESLRERDKHRADVIIYTGRPHARP